MMSLFRKGGTQIDAIRLPDPTPPAAVAFTSDRRDPAQGEQILRQWASFGTVQRRVIDSVAGEIERTAGDIETETAGVTTAFQELAVRAKAQSARVDDLTSLAETVSIDGHDVPLSAVTALVEGALGQMIQKIASLSQQAGSMVAVLDGMAKSLEQVESCIGRVEAINHRTKMLAFNARIEAVRAGDAGNAFAIVASEIKDLSNTTQGLAQTMKTHMGDVVHGIHESHDALRQVAAVDVSQTVDAERKLNQVVGALVERSAGLRRTVAESATDADKIGRQIGQIITGMQFQDRVAQRLEQVTDTLSVLTGAIGELQADTAAAMDGLSLAESPADVAWLTGLASRYKLGEMRAKFVLHVVEGRDAGRSAAPATATAAADAGSIELF